MSKIPIKGMNPAFKKVAENITKKAQVDDAIKNVRRTMAKTAESSKPIKDVIDDTVGLSIKRKANGRRDIKSAKESATVFNSNGRAVDSKLAEQIGMIRESRINQNLDQNSSDVLLKNMKTSRNQEKWDNVKSRINERRTIEKEYESTFGGSRESRSAFSNDSLINDYQKKHRVTEDILSEKDKQAKLKQDLLSKKNNRKQETPQSSGGGKGSNWVYKAAAAGVGGGMVLSMANNKGQQTNNQLYGQGGY